MKTEEFYVKLLKKIKNRQDIEIEKHRLEYKTRVYDFLKIKSRDIKPEDQIFVLRAGIHGEEVSGPLTILENINQIIDYAHKQRVKIIIYPIGNPSAFDANTRFGPDNHKGYLMCNDFVRYELEDGKMVDDLKNENKFKKWHWSSDDKINTRLTAETKLMHQLLKADPFTPKVAAFLDLHQDYKTEKVGPVAYHYAFGNLKRYQTIIEKIKNIVPLLANTSVRAGFNSPLKSDENGFIIRHDGTLQDLFARLGAKHSITAETTGTTPMDKAIQVNLVWIFGLIDLLSTAEKKPKTVSPAALTLKEKNTPATKTKKVKKADPFSLSLAIAQASILPRKITPLSRIHLIHTSSPVEDSDLKTFNFVLEKLKKEFINTQVFEVKKKELDPRYLAASEKERLRKFRQARKRANWLLPIYGGTGCGDVVRHLNEQDLTKIHKNKPVITGFSDTTFLVNYFYFKLKLLTFHYSNACGLFEPNNHRLFFDVLEGKTDSFSFFEKEYNWLTEKPKQKIEGIALGGNLSTFRDLLDISNIKVKSWKPYILFIEDVEIDVEDLHSLIVNLDAKGIFKNIRALVVGRVDEKTFARDVKKFNFIFGQKTKKEKEISDKIFTYLLQRVVSSREKQKDPFYMLRVNNFGHNVKKNQMIIPIGAKTVIYPDGKIEFRGPFVR